LAYSDLIAGIELLTGSGLGCTGGLDFWISGYVTEFYLFGATTSATFPVLKGSGFLVTAEILDVLTSDYFSIKLYST